MQVRADIDDFRVLLIEQRPRHLASANEFFAPLFRARVSSEMAQTASNALAKLRQRVFYFDLVLVNADFDEPFYADKAMPMPPHDGLTAGEVFALMAVERDSNVQCIVVRDRKIEMPSPAFPKERAGGRIAFVSANDAKWSGWWDDGEQKLVSKEEGPVPQGKPIVIDWRKAISLSKLVPDFERYTIAPEAVMS